MARLLFDSKYNQFYPKGNFGNYFTIWDLANRGVALVIYVGSDECPSRLRKNWVSQQ